MNMNGKNTTRCVSKKPVIIEPDLALAFIIGISVFVCLVLSVTVVKRYNKWKVNHSKTVE